MAKGFPSSRSANATQPLTSRGIARLENVPLVKVGAFRAKQRRTDKETNEEYEVVQVKLSLDFDSGYSQADGNGEVVTDESGNALPHLINLGYTTYTGSDRGNLVKILKAMGFSGPDYIDQEGRYEGGLRNDLDIEMVFGTNALGHDYSGKDFDDLPEYDYGDKQGPKKRDVEVPVLSWTINGYEVIGRRVDMALEEKRGYDNPTAFLPPREPEPLKTPEQMANGALAPKPTAPAAPQGAPTETVPPASDKAQRWVWDRMEELLVPIEHRTPMMRRFTSDPSITSIASLELVYCRNIRDAYREDATIFKQLHDQIIGADDFNADDDEF